MKNLETYIKENKDKNIFTHYLKVNGDGSIYIHPVNHNGDTLDFTVKENKLVPKR